MDTVEIVFKVLIVGLLVWSLRGFFLERTKKRKVGEQYLTAAELNIWLEKQKVEILKETEREMSHVRELIEKDLKRGHERFGSLENEQKETTKALNGVTNAINLLASKVERLNSGKRDGLPGDG